MSLNWALMPQKQPKRFFALKVKVDHSAVTKWFKKFKSINFEAVFQAIMANPVE